MKNTWKTSLHEALRCYQLKTDEYTRRVYEVIWIEMNVRDDETQIIKQG